ncbi:NAD(P)-dependent dehydrogenase (short-subunit alcohol dehydrogenase family) [Paenarthrobacter sp. TE4293]|uniref:hypothetical protein n=1 Tax=Paenarthrobacter sp. TE4293 TaxID=3381695 RepID=UPI003D1BF3F2
MARSLMDYPLYGWFVCDTGHSPAAPWAAGWWHASQRRRTNAPPCREGRHGHRYRLGAGAPAATRFAALEDISYQDWTWNLRHEVEVSNCVLFLASDEASYVTGATSWSTAAGRLFCPAEQSHRTMEALP